MFPPNLQPYIDILIGLDYSVQFLLDADTETFSDIIAVLAKHLQNTSKPLSAGIEMELKFRKRQLGNSLVFLSDSVVRLCEA